jgi:hypothetical protein
MRTRRQLRSLLKYLRSVLLPVHDVEKHLLLITRRTAKELNIEPEMVSLLEETAVKSIHYLELSTEED